jgi:glutathionylspermidine synthase
MKRCISSARTDWQGRVESQGLHFHSTPVSYWDETAYYQFDAAEIDRIEKATTDLHAMCLEAVEHIIRENLFDRFRLAENWADYVVDSWERDAPTVYGRFDLGYDGSGPPKLLEYNADTPTALLEAAVIQWHWLHDTHRQADQFNGIHERLIARWRELGGGLPSLLHFAAVAESLEDQITVTYLRDTAMQAGFDTEGLTVEQIGWDYSRRLFVDLRNRPIAAMFKLYPWEWLIRDRFGPFILHRTTAWIEPTWKMLLSNKVILAILWELFPDHPNLLRTEVAPFSDSFVRKPCLGREGANVQIVFDGREIAQTEGVYSGPFVYQDIFPLPRFDGNFPVLGSWIIGDTACGMGIRESTELVTQNTSRFVPHLFLPQSRSVELSFGAQEGPWSNSG